MADTDKVSGPPEWSSGYVPTVLHFKDGKLHEPAWAGNDWGRMEAFADTPSSGGGGPPAPTPAPVGGHCQKMEFKEGDSVPAMSGHVESAIYADGYTNGGYPNGNRNDPGWAPNGVKDVTAIVQALVSQGGSWNLNNGTMQGDPCPGMGKKLYLTICS